MQSIAVYQFSDRILVHPWQQTESGLGIASGPYLALPADADSGKLGAAILDVLQAGSRYVSVARKGEKLLIEPSRNGGTSGDAKGHEPLPERTLTVAPKSSAQDIGAATHRGFRNCL